MPPYQEAATRAEKRARQAFSDQVIDRLFALNAERATAEREGAQSTVVPMSGAALRSRPANEQKAGTKAAARAGKQKGRTR